MCCVQFTRHRHWSSSSLTDFNSWRLNCNFWSALKWKLITKPHIERWKKYSCSAFNALTRTCWTRCKRWRDCVTFTVAVHRECINETLPWPASLKPWSRRVWDLKENSFSSTQQVANALKYCLGLKQALIIQDPLIECSYAIPNSHTDLTIHWNSCDIQNLKLFATWCEFAWIFRGFKSQVNSYKFRVIKGQTLWSFLSRLP